MYFALSNQIKPLNLVDQSQDHVTNALPVSGVRSVTFALGCPCLAGQRGCVDRPASTVQPGPGAP